jgi:hypothetical protein
VSKLNKISVVFIILIVGCHNGAKNNLSTEIICDDGRKVLVDGVKKEEIIHEARRQIALKNERKTSDGYTGIMLKNGETILFKGISPENFIKCLFKDVVLKDVKNEYLY